MDTTRRGLRATALLVVSTITLTVAFAMPLVIVVDEPASAAEPPDASGIAAGVLHNFWGTSQADPLGITTGPTATSGSPTEAPARSGASPSTAFSPNSVTRR